MGIRYTKKAITISQQIDVLKRRGLIVDDEVQAERVLDIISYFRLADYWRFMETDRLTHQFKSGYVHILWDSLMDGRKKVCGHKD